MCCAALPGHGDLGGECGAAPGWVQPGAGRSGLRLWQGVPHPLHGGDTHTRPPSHNTHRIYKVDKEVNIKYF